MTGADYWAALGPVLLGLALLGFFIGSIWLLRRKGFISRTRENLDEPQRGTVSGGHLTGDPPQVNRRD